MTNALGVGQIPTFEQRHRIVRAREVAGMKQAELAEAIGVSRGTLATVEQGTRAARAGEIIAIAFACGVDVNWLKTGETPADPQGGDGGAECAIRDSNPEPAELFNDAA